MSQISLTFGSLSLIGILGMLAVIARFLPLRTGLTHAARNRSVERRETVVLDSKRRLHLIEWQGGTILLLTGGQQDVVVGRVRSSHES